MIKWVGRLAVLTGILGLIGTIIIIINIQREVEDEKIGGAEKTKETHGNSVSSDSVTSKPRLRQKVAGVAKPPTASKKADAVQKQLPQRLPSQIVKEEKVSIPEPAKKNDKKNKADRADDNVIIEKQNRRKSPEEKLLTEQDLQQLVNRINLAKEEHNIYQNCVQICSSSRSNNKNNMTNIEYYLRSQRFAIAGRETVSRKVKGIQIVPNGECIRIIVGDL